MFVIVLVVRTTESRLDNLEAADIGKEVADGLVGVGAEVGGL